MKKGITLRAIALLLLIILPILSLPSCSLDDEDAFLAAARDLITRSVELNEIYFGEGIEYDSELGGIGIYYYATDEYLERVGISTVDDLKEITREVFSEEYCRIIFQSAFEGINYNASEDPEGDFSGVQSSDSIVYARYSSDKIASEGGTGTGRILVNSSYKAYDGMLAYSREYDLDSLEIKKVRSRTVTVTLRVTYTLRDGYKDFGSLVGTHEKEIVFERLDDGGYRINSSTY